MKEVIELNGGIFGVIFKYVKIFEIFSNKFMIKWDGMSIFNNFQFYLSGVKVWKVYKIGFGKVFLWNDIQSGSSFLCVLEVLEFFV